jgi:hypothetical protein
MHKNSVVSLESAQIIEANDIANAFLDIYPSARTYKTALQRMFELVQKTDLTTMNFKDFQLCEEKTTKNTFRCIKSFFRYLYSSELLKDEVDFAKYFGDKVAAKKHYEKDRNQKGSEIKSNLGILTFENVERLIDFSNSVEIDDIDNLRLAFCFYILYYEDIDSNDLRDLDANNYTDGTLTIKNRQYCIPVKYRSLFVFLKDRTQTKFSSLHIYVTKLGNKVGIKDLSPKDIKDAHKRNLIKCPNCNKYQLSFAERWRNVNGRLLCVDCADAFIQSSIVKKNDKCKIEQVDVEILSPASRKLIWFSSSSYDKLLSSIKFPTDFSQLDDFLERVGKFGERYVFEAERKRLYEQNSKYWEEVDDSPANDHIKAMTFYHIQLMANKSILK